MGNPRKTTAAGVIGAMTIICAVSTSLAIATPQAKAWAEPVAEGQAKALTIAGYPAFALRDGAFDRPNDGKGFVLGVPPSVAGALLSSHQLPADHFDFSLQPLLVRAKGRVLLFDTGAGTNMGPGAGRLLMSLARARVRPEEVTDIFISHGHGDHVGGLATADGRAIFPKATVHISRAEWTWLRGMSKAEAANFLVGDHDALIAAVAPKVAPFAPDAVLIPGLVQAIDVRGHSPGHSAYRIGTGKTSVVFIGDTLHHYVTSVAHPEWQVAFDGDRPLAERSRIDNEKQWARTGQRLYVGHFPFPGYGTIERQGSTYGWRPLP